jgi:hypothetical protein
MRTYTVTLDDPLEVVYQITRIINEFHTVNRIAKMEYYQDFQDKFALQARIKVHWESVQISSE